MVRVGGLAFPERAFLVAATDRAFGGDDREQPPVAVVPATKTKELSIRWVAPGDARNRRQPVLGVGLRVTGSCLLEPLYTSRTDVVDLIALGFTATEGDPLMSVYKVIEIIGSSSQSWEDAATEAIETARQTVRDLRVAEVVEQDLDLADGDTITFRTKLRVSFKYEGE